MSDPTSSSPSARSLRLDPARQALLEKLLEQEKLAHPGRQAIPPRSGSGPARLSFAQERLLYLDLLDGPGSVYTVPLAFLLQGPLDAAAFERALNRLVQRHEILRTRFVMVDGEPRQLVDPELHIPLIEEDLRSFPLGEREAEALRRARTLGRIPFDLSAAPLLRAALWRLDDERWLFFLALHHNIFDEWSQGVFYRELAAVYQAEMNGGPLDLPLLPIQYADYAEWQAGWLQGEAAAQQLAYWKAKLAGAPQVLELPADRPRPAVQSRGGAMHTLTIPGTVLDGLRRIARQEQVTLFSTLLAVYGELLRRYTGQPDLLIGTPVTNRRQPELDSLVGFFLNTLAMRIDMSDRPTFRQLVRRTGQVVLEALDNQDVPFERIVEELHVRRDLSRHPLFQAAFVLHPAGLDNLELPGVQAVRRRIDLGTAKFDLTLTASEHSDDLELFIEYAADLFQPETAERILGHYARLLAAVVAGADSPLERLDMLEPEERRKLLYGWNQTDREYPRDGSLAELFAIQAQRFQDAPALLFGDRQMTYADLEAASNRLARYLRRLGAGREMLVGLSLDRSVEMVVGMLGILKAGGAYLPLDPGYPSERLAYMLADSHAAIVVTVEKNRLDPAVFATERSGVRVVAVDSADVQAESPAAPEPVSGPLDLAYVMYTSGSTGRPKGIAIPQRAVVRLVKGSDYLQIEAGEQVAQASNMSFDAATWEIWGALLNGATLVGLEADVLLSPPAYADTLRKRGIDHVFMTTALFNQIAAVQPDAFNSLQTVLFGGEAVTPGWVRAVLAAGGPQRLLHVYGPTESTTFATWHLVEAVAEGVRTLPIGRPIANTTAYVLDEARQPAPLGVAGELYLGGDGLARGYWKRPELTAEKFIRNPFVAGPEGPDGEAAKEPDPEPGDPRLYATGDLVRRLADGALEYLGRIDRQVKLRGFRIELGEIEAAAAEHSQVEAVAVELYGEGEEKRLVGYVVWRGGEAGEVRQLREHLSRRLPGYMLPAQWVSLESLPLNPNGKIDRRRLPPPPVERADVQGYTPPKNELEAELCRLWEDVLQVHPVGVQDDFFELGGHSLLAMRLFTRLEQVAGQRLPLATLFRAPTVAALAEILSSQQESGGWSALVPIQTEGTRPAFYCVHNFGGEALDLAPLAHELGSDQPFYALQALGLDGVHKPHSDLTEMAAYYVEAIGAHQPHGPYFLGGFCFGGVVAYEMARQMRQRGETIALLAAIDAGPPGVARQSGGFSLQWLVNSAANLPYWLRDFLRLPPSERAVVVRRRFKRIEKSLRSRLSGVRDDPMDHSLTPVELIGENNVNVLAVPEHRRSLMETHLQALLNYSNPSYEGCVTVFRIRRMPLFSQQPRDLGWSKVARSVSVRLIPGSHHSLLQSPDVEGLAGELRLAIDASIQAGNCD